MAEPPIGLTLERLNRLERLVTERFDATDKRFDTLESSLGKMVTVLEAHEQRLESIMRRLDHALVSSTHRGFERGSSRMSDIDRRLRALEERQPTP